ncbi:protein bicaudal C homolog 1-like isoform X1 [Daphnia carinata]|uniref:protein bicaudal C homolog 1-like isoform X1 n=1 Tax=Daphnia carinata TaxID=120202 RepID=UPI0025809E84|nr:protein bicaudal C homolog 1-like isoform X1 [Daphnia carinata]
MAKQPLKQGTASATLTLSATLSMEVSYTFHSHLIGRSGQNINRLMEETGTRIHFPDRNRITGEPKCNNVVIRGQLPNLEKARQRIRMDIPVEIIVDCSSEKISSLGQGQLIDYFSKNYGVLLRFYPKIDGLNCQVNIRGQQYRIHHLKEAVTSFGCLTQTSLDSMMMKIETSFDHVWLVRDHVDKIAHVTGAGIRCPDVSHLKELPKKYCIWIKGSSLDAVYIANTMLNGLLPMQLMVQIPSERMNRCFLAEAEEADVLFHAEPSVMDILTIRLTSYEWNARNLFEILRRCFGLPTNQAVVPSLPQTWKTLDFTRKNFLPTSKKLLKELSSSHQNTLSQQFGGIVVEIPSLSSADESVGSASLSSPLAWIESCVPASLTASRFDQNSFRRLSDLLETVGLAHYSDLFFQNEIDMAMFTTMNDEDLISLGITSFGARKIMRNAIQELRS